jgi:hypothetical protein
LKFRILFPRLFAFALASASLVIALPSCEIINPEEEIPAFVHIDEFSFTTVEGQGYPVHSLTDAWVFVDEEFIGTYELPATIPILSAGPTNLRIEPGVRVSGLVGQRSVNPFMRKYSGTVALFPDSQVVINPAITYEDWVTFKWMEAFENVGFGISNTSNSEGSVQRISGPDAFAGNSLKMSIPSGSYFMECSSDLAYTLPAAAAPVFLEFTYRNNNSMYIGLISRTLSGVTQTSILVLNPSEQWKHVYVNLTETVSSSTLVGALGHQVFFGFIRDEGVEGEAYAFLDNIKLMH